MDKTGRIKATGTRFPMPLLIGWILIGLVAGGLTTARWVQDRSARSTAEAAMDAIFAASFKRWMAMPEAKRQYIEAEIDKGAFYRKDPFTPDVERAKQSLRTNPRDAKALRTLAEHATSVTHRYNEAIRWLKQAKQVDPANEFYDDTLGILYRFVGDNAKARTAFEACAARGGYYGNLCNLGLEDMKRHPNLRQSNCADCDRP